ncbi:DUF3276 family protein [Draconibacterium sp. IB214405]|uniref:DUF3276 family protein n=1 Tax=Draconibacterium sp. IB214405 TaxID=3097352 RepID=UPI002A0D6169|nr:DUF3276 family protein [Draconibacterium sp. IB214405]MDX8340473.1 DUF3276 family protein [Draconibacterium sp. IB214405]
MESGETKEGAKFKDSKFKQEIHSKVIRAGKRTYFFDVKSTRNDEYYLTITESKKRFGDNGKFSYEKHKIFLYKEDFTKFIESLQEVVEFIHDKQPEEVREEAEVQTETEEVVEEEAPVKDYTSVEFEDI